MPKLVYTDKGHKYELDGKKLTGVTTVLGVIAKPMLIGWAAKQTAEWIRENCTTLMDAQMPHYGNDGWAVTKADLEQAVKAHTKKKEAAGEKGTDTHAEVEAYIKRVIERYDGNARPQAVFDAPCSPALAKFMRWGQDNNIRFLSSETPVYHSEKWYAGTPDFTFEKEGKRYVGDLKTMKKMWDRVPFFQTAAYMMALEHMGEEKYDGSCIVNINKETGELTDHWTYDHENDKRAFEAALTLYRQLGNF